MPRKGTKKPPNRHMHVYAAQANLEEKLAIWQEVLRTGDLTDDERSTHDLEERMSQLRSNGRKQKKEHELDANVFEPVQQQQNEEAHSLDAL